MAKIYTYETTYETEDSEGGAGGETEVRFRYAFTPGTPARIRFDEHDHPPEAAEIDIQAIQVGAGQALAGWLDVSKEEYYVLLAWAEAHRWDALIENAVEEEASAHEAAAEHAYETRRDLERIENDR